MKKTILLLLAVCNLAPGLVANTTKQCTVAYEVMYQIALNEHHPKRKVGYPFIIAFNKGMKVIAPEGTILLDSRTIDCKNQDLCVSTTRFLVENNITNLDLGAFQINYKQHPQQNLDKYFDLNWSYAYACSYIEKLTARFGWSWKTLGMYHNMKDEFNKPYVEKIQKRVYAKMEN